MTHFRIFIDAATLKPGPNIQGTAPRLREFPHLYRCGHIEANGESIVMDFSTLDFRIFIDAATLKPRA